MKKYCIVFLALLLCLAMPLTVCAAAPRLVDQAGLLTVDQQAEILNGLDSLSSKHGMDLVIVTTETLNGMEPMDYADDFFDYNGYREDGILLLISMEDRDWWISTCGDGITAMNDDAIELTGERFTDYLSSGDYAEAFRIYMDTCDEMIIRAKDGDPYKAPFSFFSNLMICLIIGFVVGLIATLIMKGQLKSVQFQSGAADYMKPGSLNVTHRQDIFLYRDVQRREKPKSSSGSGTHTSSSGRSHGGGGGKF